MKTRSVRGVLFDLDGTLVDSAPDLVGTLNDLRRRHDLPALPYLELRPYSTRGALGLLEAGFPELDSASRIALRDDFLSRYRERLWQESFVFEGMQALLGVLEQAGLSLGIVTNKIESLARPLVEQAGWHHLFGTLVAGDTTRRSKPDPLPVLTACGNLGLLPSQCVLVGDDRRDVQAGEAAGVATIAVTWGYIEADDDPHTWGADRVVHQVDALTQLLSHID
ncbi:MAG: HAD-IA family hydrolase [Pseudomonadota bacterium]